MAPLLHRAAITKYPSYYRMVG